VRDLLLSIREWLVVADTVDRHVVIRKIDSLLART
jgi:hypothetical protein